MHSRFDNFSSSLLSPDALVHVSTEICKEVGKIGDADSFVEESVTPIKELITSVNTLLSRGDTKNYTETSRNLDRARDKNYRRFVRFVEDQAATADIDPVIAAEAEKIVVVIKANAVDVEASYDEESAQLNRFIPAMKPFLESMNRIGAKTRFEALVSDATHFEAYRQTQSREQADKIRGEVAPVVKELAFELNALLTYLESQARRQKGVYESAVSMIVSITDRVMTPARANQTRKANVREEKAVVPAS